MESVGLRKHYFLKVKSRSSFTWQFGEYKWEKIRIELIRIQNMSAFQLNQYKSCLSMSLHFKDFFLIPPTTQIVLRIIASGWVASQSLMRVAMSPNSPASNYVFLCNLVGTSIHDWVKLYNHTQSEELSNPSSLRKQPTLSLKFQRRIALVKW